MKSEQRRNAALYALVGDALALGPHWIYSQAEIKAKAGRISGYLNPMSEYHPGKRAGDQTHYGDQTMTLLRSLVSEKGFVLDGFAKAWRSFWENPSTESYRDGATKATLQNLQNGVAPSKSASASNDIAGAGRIAPLFLLAWKSPEDLVEAARLQTALTHGDPAVIEAAEFFARLALRVSEGSSVPDALNATAEMDHWKAIPPEWLSSATRTAAETRSALEAAEEHGLSCHIDDAFPVIIDLLLRYPDNAVKGLVANAEAGGDSAARGLLLGLVYGAAPKPEPLPAMWLAQLVVAEEFDELTQALSV